MIETWEHFGCKFRFQIYPTILNLGMAYGTDFIFIQIWLKISKTFIEYVNFVIKIGTISINKIINWHDAIWIKAIISLDVGQRHLASSAIEYFT